MSLLSQTYSDLLRGRSQPVPPLDPLDIKTDQERRAQFLRMLNYGWLGIGFVALLSLLTPYFHRQPVLPITIVVVTGLTYILIRTLNERGHTRIAGAIFSVIVNLGFLGFFFVAAEDIGLETALETETPTLMMMGFAIIFAGAVIHRRAAYVFALANSVLLIVLINMVAPSSDPRPSIHITWWLMALVVSLYESTLGDAFARLRGARQNLERLVEERTAQLRDAKDEVEAILDNTSDAIVLINKDGDIQKINKVFEKLSRVGVRQNIEQLFELLGRKEDSQLLDTALRNALENGSHERCALQLQQDQERVSDIDVALAPIVRNDAEPGGVVLSLRDITHIRELDRFKMRFVANAVHDLGNPVAVLKTHLYLLKKTPQNADKSLVILDQEVQRLEYLVNDLRSLSELDRGALTLDLQQVHINHLISHLVDTHMPVAQDKQQKLFFEPADNLPSIEADIRKCERVLVNLLSNALQYTPEGGTITISTRLATDNVIVQVQDSGIGIGATDLPHIFERFYRSDETRASHEQGNGLGLAIVKEMVEAHGGTISVTSKKEEGTTFQVQLPVSQSLKP